MRARALVLLSGGQDSTTCLAQALRDFPKQVEAVAFDYGQRHKIELKCAQKIARMADVSIKIINVKLLSQLTNNALTNSKLKIKTPKNKLPNTFVPGRNLLFLNLASIYAKQKGIKKIYMGVCQTDYSGYPDCRDEFIRSCNQTLNLALDDELEIITPLMWLTKAETVKLMQDLGCLDWLKYSHTCYYGKRPACGECPACRLRKKGFEEAGVKDPMGSKLQFSVKKL